MTLNPRQRFRLETVLFFAASLALAGLAVHGRWFQSADRWIYDVLVRAKSAPQLQDLVIVGIDDQSLDAFGPWPWPRSRQAELLAAINRAAPRAVLLDVVYAGHSAPEEDAALVASASSADVLALPIMIDSIANRRQLIEVMPYPALLEHAQVLGHVHVRLDEDAIVRGSYLFEGVGSPHWPHITLALANQLGLVDMEQYACRAEGEDAFSIAKNQCGYVYTPFGGRPGSFAEISALDVMTSSATLASLQAKIVFVGVVASGTTDLLTTPVSSASRAMSGIEYNANLFSALAQGLTTRGAGSTWIYLLNLLCVSLPVLVLPRRKAKGMLGSAALCATFPIAVATFAMIAAGTWIPTATAAIICLAAYPYWSWRRHEVAWQFVEAEIGRLEEERTRWGTPSHDGEQRTITRLADFLDAEVAKPAQSWILDARDTIEANGESGPRLVRSRPYSVSERRLADAALASVAEESSSDERLPGELLIAEIRRLQELAREVRLGREIGQRSLERMPSGVVVFSALGEVLYSNSAARRFLGITEDAPGDYAELLKGISPPLGQNWHDLARGVVLDRRSVSFETRAAGGEQVVVEAGSLADPATGTDTWVLTITDMTDIHSAERDREEALAFLSHDLRSPMLSILALVRGSDRQPPLDQVGDYAQRALQVSDQFVQLSRVQARESFETYEVNVLSVLSNALDQMFALAREKQIEFSADPILEEDEEGVWLQGNGELLERAFANLLSNAIKYSQPGSRVDVAIEYEAREISISIVDRGPGIPAEELPFIFDPFFRSAAKELAQERGAGLGLRFVKTVIERHGGRVDVESEYGRGSRFTVTLPKLGA